MNPAVVGGTPTVISGAVLGAPLSPASIIQGSITFQGQNESLLNQTLQQIYDPSSPNYHHFLTDAQYDQYFGPNPAMQARLLAYLQSHGIQVQQVVNTLWQLTGTSSAMGQAFGTTFYSASRGTLTGYAPETPLKLPSQFASMVQLDGGFQTVAPPVPSIMHPTVLDNVPAPRSVQTAIPDAALTVNISNQYILQYQKAGPIAFPPTQMNLTWNITIAGGTAPYHVSLHWGDTSIQHFTTSLATNPVFHMYYNPAQSDYCDAQVCGNVSVWVTDSATPTAGNASIVARLIPGWSPTAAHTFYNLLPLYKMGDTGLNTYIGIDDMCDKTYPTADYRTDINSFSAKMGLPEMSTTTLQFIGTGATTCGTGSSGWSGETLLDMEWAHTMAPNATIMVDLANTALDEGDQTWNTLTNDVFIVSNSWTYSGYHANYWTTAASASHGESYLSASGDCGGLDLESGSDHPADNPNGIGVGGTQVYPYPSGVFRAEYAWNSTDDPTCLTSGANDAGSAGGQSTAFTAPGYQTGMQGFGYTDRGVPDIAAVGGTWVMMVYEGGITLSAGTSLACPSSAAMLDLMYQYNGSATGAKGNGMADYDFYAIAKTSNLYHVAFHDITVGTNKVGAYGGPTTPGWDEVTGLGSFNVSQLAQMVAARNLNANPYSAITSVIVANVTYGPDNLAVNFGADVAGGPSSLTGYSYAWTFGDGSTAVTSTYYTNHVYTCGATFGAYVTVSNGAYTPGVSNTLNIKAVGTACPLTAGSVTLNRTGPGEPGYGVAINASFMFGTSTFTPTFMWGDGSKTVGTPVSTSPASAAHVYLSGGTYTPRVYINDSAANSVNMVPATPVTVDTHVSVTAVSPSSGSLWTPPANLTFSATIANGAGPFTYSWTFGNGNTSTAASPPYQIYYKPGTYTVTLAVTDSLNYHAINSYTFTVFGTAATITLQKGQNLIALPTVHNSYTLYELSVIAGPSFAGMDMLNGITSTLYDRTTDAANGNTALVGGEALWLNVSAAETITVYGNTTGAGTLAGVSFAPGWSGIGWSVSSGTTASALAGKISGALMISIWSATTDQWATFLVRLDAAGGAHDFAIAAGSAVLVYTTGTGTFTE
jgi:subtilase family serine protease